jgi:hypothetical protein
MMPFLPARKLLIRNQLKYEAAKIKKPGATAKVLSA